MAKHPRIPAQPEHTVESLTQQYGSEEGIVEAFLLHQLSDEDHHVLSPTWMACCLLRRVISKLEEVRAAVRGEPPFDTPDFETFHARRPRRRLTKKSKRRR